MPLRIEPFTEKRNGFTIMGHRLFFEPHDDAPSDRPSAARGDVSCPICSEPLDPFKEGKCPHTRYDIAAALQYHPRANARIAELVRERDEARKDLREIYDAEPVLVAERHKVWEKARDDGFREGYAKGVSAAKEACAKRLEREAVNRSDCSCSGCDTVRKWLRQSSHIVRETEVPGP